MRAVRSQSNRAFCGEIFLGRKHTTPQNFQIVTTLNEQKKRQRAKPLFHRLATSEDGKAVFYSPPKIQAARELQKEEQQAKEATIALKAEEKLQHQLQKEEKRRLVEQRKAQQVQDKLQRQK